MKYNFFVTTSHFVRLIPAKNTAFFVNYKFIPPLFMVVVLIEGLRNRQLNTTKSQHYWWRFSLVIYKSGQL